MCRQCDEKAKVFRPIEIRRQKHAYYHAKRGWLADQLLIARMLYRGATIFAPYQNTARFAMMALFDKFDELEEMRFMIAFATRPSFNKKVCAAPELGSAQYIEMQEERRLWDRVFENRFPFWIETPDKTFKLIHSDRIGPDGETILIDEDDVEHTDYKIPDWENVDTYFAHT